VVTVTLIVINVLAFLWAFTQPEALYEHLFQWGVIPRIVTKSLAGKYSLDLATWLSIATRFVTAMFLHGGWLHLISNIWYLWIFGDNIEDRLGHVGYVVFYLVCGVGASAAHVVMNPTAMEPMIGASGAIAGVLGAYLICFPRARVMTLVPVFFMPLFIRLPAVVVLGSWFIMQIFNGGATIGASAQQAGGVAWWAHIGGFVIGMILVRFLPARRKRRQVVYRPHFDRR
jgi:membrane associated rhomboid family serine protease